MADYYSIMANAVSALDWNTRDARRQLYERARAALITQMRGTTPALDQSDILAAPISLEEAIRRVEAEARRGLKGAEPGQTDGLTASRYQRALAAISSPPWFVDATSATARRRPRRSP
jgi:hypothetical protein